MYIWQWHVPPFLQYHIVTHLQISILLTSPNPNVLVTVLLTLYNYSLGGKLI